MRKLFKLRIRDLAMIGLAFAATVIGIKASDNMFHKPADSGREDGRCPAEMAYIDTAIGGFCIDKYEAATGAECYFRSPANQAESRTDLEEQACVPVSEKGRIPWTNLSQSQAILACSKAGKRLPTSEEWFAAALGTPDQAGEWSADDCHVNFNWERQPGGTGSGKNCLSSKGAYDMIGNVWEWVNETVTDGHLKERELPEQGYVASADENGVANETAETPDANYYNDYLWVKKQGTRGVARGGYWDNQDKAGQYSMYLVSLPSFAGVGVGFRCVK